VKGASAACRLIVIIRIVVVMNTALLKS